MLDQYVADAASFLASIIRRYGYLNKVCSDLAVLWESVYQGRMSSALLNQILAELLAKRPQTVEERAVIDACIAVVVRGMQAQGLSPIVSPPEAATAPAALLVPCAPALSPSSPYYGLGLREAGPAVLSRSNKQPQTSRQIWEVLHAEGYQTAHRDPVHAVHDALRRRARTHNDVLLVGEGKWGRKEWYTEDQLAQIKKSVGGMGGRDKAAHGEATTKGMLVAMARGAKPGQPTKLTPEKIAIVEEMIRSGSSVHDVAGTIGVAAGTIYNHFPSERLRQLRTEGARRDREKEEGDRPPSLRIVT